MANYAFQLDYYATVLCENKEVKENECQGMCHLASELRFQTVEMEHEQSPSVNFHFTPVFLEQMSTTLCDCDNYIIFHTPSGRTILVHPSDVFHPPEIV